MSDLALAVFAAETGAHLVEEPRERRFARFERDFDERAYRATLAARGLRFLGRGEGGFPPLVHELPDPPPGLFLRGGSDVGLPAPSRSLAHEPVRPMARTSPASSAASLRRRA